MKKQFNSISSKLNFILSLITIVVLAISGLFSYNHFSNKAYNQLEQDIKQITKRLQLTLPTVIWNLQNDLILDIIKTEANDKNIDSIIIKDIDNSIIAQTNKDIKIKDDTTKYHFTIHHMNEKIANIFIYHNNSSVQEARKDIINLLFTKTILIIILLLILSKIFIDKFIISNITKLRDEISYFAKTKDFNTKIFINSNDEIEFLALEFNNMKNELKENWEQLENLNKGLEDKINNEVLKNREKDKKLFESSKMAQMGEMIGNIAHQWRQPLSAISTLASGIQAQKEFGLEVTDQNLDKTFDKIIERTEFLTQTIEDFRNFTKEDKESSSININDTIKTTLSILKDTIKHLDITINLILEEGCYVHGFKGEISQVILNILNNAKDILAETKKDKRIINIISYKQDNKIIIEISDNAGGIPDDILPKIFDPYFTTKHKSQGTGIGLYMSKDIIEKHHKGKLSATNNNEGAIFTIELLTEKL